MKHTNYLVDSLKGNLFLKGIDAFFSCFPQKKLYHPLEPKNILLCNGAHLGDIILSTSILPSLKASFPHARIGFLAGSWAQQILEDHQYIDTIHTLDHWRLNRSDLSLKKKIAHYYRQKKDLVKELQRSHYDLAIDLYPFFPNNIFLLYQANIPVRIGYTSAGWGRLLTHPFPWEKKEQSIAFYFQDLLVNSGLGSPALSMKPHLSYRNPLPSVSLPSEYVVFHMGTGDPKREWSLEKWKQLLNAFIEKKKTVIFTGQGEREKKHIQHVTENGTLAIDLSNKLTIKELITTLSGASELISVNTASVHIASAFSIPTTILYPGTTDIPLWQPLNDSIRPVYKKTACFPCLKRQGCASMECLQGIEVEDVCRGL